MRRSWLLVGLVLLVTVLLLPVFWDFARHVLLPELWSVVQVVRIVFASLPQLPIWLLYIVLILFVAAASLLGPPDESSERGVSLPERPGQVVVLAERLRRVREGEYYRWDLARELSTLILDVLAHDQRTSRAELQLCLRTEQLDVPPEVMDYLRSGQAPIYTLSMLPFARLRRLLSAETWNEPLDPEVEQVVEYIEGLVEVQHDTKVE